MIRGAAVAVTLLLVPVPRLHAQRGIVTQGARELLTPVGARVIGTGQAAVSTELGSDGLWWNPASTAQTPKAEAGLHHVQTVAYSADLLGLIYPVRRVGVVGAGVHYVNLGCSDLTDEVTGEVTGQECSRALTSLASFGTTFPGGVSAGVTYKFFQAKYLLERASTAAVDFGAQYRVGAVRGLTVGGAVRHLGLRLQVKDEAQADALPTTYEVGASYQRRVAVADTAVHAMVAVSVIDRVASEGPGFRLGAEAHWRNAYFARAGYVISSPNGSAPAIGLGVSTGRLRIDIARIFGSGDYSGALGEPPTYLSLRMVF